jgi:hypothetical protein
MCLILSRKYRLNKFQLRISYCLYFVCHWVLLLFIFKIPIGECSHINSLIDNFETRFLGLRSIYSFYLAGALGLWFATI